jgi:hypothetical protein
MSSSTGYLRAIPQGNGVTSISGGSTGLTPATPTTGAVTLAGRLNVAYGGTGATTLTANNVLLGNGTSAVQTVAPGATGNVLTSNGTTWASSAPSGGAVTGQTIQYGSSTTPSGYLKCDGSTYNISAYPTLAGVLGSLPTSQAQYNAFYTTVGGATGGYGVSYVNNFVVISNSSGLYYSSNGGVSWTKTTPTSFFVGSKIGWTGTNYFGYSYGSNQFVYTSALTNTAWTIGKTNASDVTTANFALYTGTRAILNAYYTNPCNGAISFQPYYSTTNGASWVLGTAVNAYAPFAGAFGAGIIVSVGQYNGGINAIYTSTDGATYTSRTVPTGMNGIYLASCSFANNLFVVVDNNNNVCSSPDGITWTYKGNAGVYGDVVYLSSTSLYYMNGRYSSDLITWNVLPLTPGAYAYTLIQQVTDGTRIITLGGSSWNPFPYTTGTQFIVPNFGANALGSGTWGAYNYIKT